MYVYSYVILVVYPSDCERSLVSHSLDNHTGAPISLDVLFRDQPLEWFVAL